MSAPKTAQAPKKRTRADETTATETEAPETLQPPKQLQRASSPAAYDDAASPTSLPVPADSDGKGSSAGAASPALFDPQAEAAAAALYDWVQSSELKTTSFQSALSNSPAAAGAAAYKLRTAMMALDTEFWDQADGLPEVKTVEDDTLYSTMDDSEIAERPLWEQTYARALKLFDERYQAYSDLLFQLDSKATAR